jgi:glycine cleavage system aminomethyltransferase T
LSTQHITVAGVDQVRALRVTYTGELGWELHVPMAGMLDVYSALVSTPHSENLVHIGSATLNAVLGLGNHQRSNHNRGRRGAFLA